MICTLSTSSIKISKRKLEIKDTEKFEQIRSQIMHKI